MPVAGRDAVSVVDDDGAPVASHEIGKGYGAVGRREHGLSDYGGNIHAGVECAFTVEWIDALAKRAGNLAFDRPEIRSGVGAHPVGGGGILGQAQRDADASRLRVMAVCFRAYSWSSEECTCASSICVGRRIHQDRVGFEAVQGGNFAGQRSQRSHLDIAFFGDLLQARSSGLSVLLFRCGAG